MRTCLPIAWAGHGHPKNLITQGGLGRLKPLLKEGLPKSPKVFHASNGRLDGVNVGW
jgi:hypothetical protein